MICFKPIELVVLFALVVIIVLVLPGCLPMSDAAEEPPSVLVVTLSSVHRMWPPKHIDFTDRNYTLDYDRGGYLKAIDFNYKNKSFCYVQPVVLYRRSVFRCASADNFTRRWELPSPTLFPSQFSVASIAYDWASGAWYFADKQQRCLYVCDSSLQHCRMLRRDLEDPRGLAVDPTPPANDSQAAGFVFWSQNNTSPSRLVRSSLAGGSVTGLLSKDCSGPCHPKALTLDIANKLIFWVDGEADTVEQTNYDGSGSTTVYKIKEAYTRIITVFSWFESALYLPGYRGIFTTPLKGNETYTTINGFPSTALVYHGSRQPQVSHPCADNNGGCQHICATAYNGSAPVARCLCQHGFQLDAAKHGVCTRIQLETFMLVSRGIPPLVEVRASPSSAAEVTASTTQVAATTAQVASPTAPAELVAAPAAEVTASTTQVAATTAQVASPTAPAELVAAPAAEVTASTTQVAATTAQVTSPTAPAELVAAPAASHKPTVADVDTESEYTYFFDFAFRQILRQKLDGTGREVFIKDRLYECQGLAIDWMGRNACSENNGGCAELCLATAGGRACACAAGRAPLATDYTRCVQTAAE